MLRFLQNFYRWNMSSRHEEKNSIHIFYFGVNYHFEQIGSPHHVIRASAQQHAPFIQEGEGLRSSGMSLKTPHTGGGGH